MSESLDFLDTRLNKIPLFSSSYRTVFSLERKISSHLYEASSQYWISVFWNPFRLGFFPLGD